MKWSTWLICTQSQQADNPGTIEPDWLDWPFDGVQREKGGGGGAENNSEIKGKRGVEKKIERENEDTQWDISGGYVRTSSPSAGLSGEVEEAVGEDEEEVEDGDEGEVSPPGLTSASFFSFRSTCLLFVPGERERHNKW